MDDSLPFMANILLACCFSLAGVAVVLCLTQPLVLALLPPLALAYRWLQVGAAGRTDGEGVLSG